ncbi:SusC/RagA family TonB-linked outer membrane protein [Rudanella paleaurantiibacter]|uniref:SusC/RagA family TonB-linked outer membrane protein n=1 Tax=Rudanella paleaurantiibacter TaxID=2614655 RepID=A0A7J5TUC7_9BACT|nr:SusC/RagA family TonB-linked outer membrane protein [Rudanella paleaurantiibacter]KAB7727614.1 SusC/RagA family TonB-linked outer membrane protein [Rudanella paleaurantiibacter]
MNKPLLYGCMGLWLLHHTTSAQTLAMAPRALARQQTSDGQPARAVRLTDALNSLQQRYRVDILFEEAGMNQVMVPGQVLSRTNTLEAGLTELLKSTGFEFRQLKNGAYVVRRADRRARSVSQTDQATLPESTADETGNRPETTRLADDRTITGKVTDGLSGQGLPGVNIAVKGTSRGTTTDGEGNFKLAVPAEATTLVFSFIGYQTREVPLTSESVLAVALSSSDQTLNEVVVTALGIKREKKALTYATGEIQGRDLVGARETNLANALSAKVPGVQVTSSAGGMSGSSRVVIRGNSSLSGNSQPLYVIDGVPIDNSNRRSIGSFALQSGLDGGDGISNLNPNDIESISVLKGPNGAALYGQLGANGVILITTKAGRRNRKPTVSYSGNVSVGRALVKPDYQSEYGQGYNGAFTFYRKADGSVVPYDAALTGGIPKLAGGRNPTTRGSWGPKMQGQTYEDMWGDTLQYRPIDDPYTAFFRPERQMSHTLSVDGGGENTNYFISVANLSNDGFVPTNTLKRNSVTVKVATDIVKGLNLDMKLNYINQAVVNRPYVGDDGANPVYRFLYVPRSLSMDGLRRYEYSAKDIRLSRDLGGNGFFVGGEKIFESNSVTSNPFWTINNTRNGDTRDRVIGYAKLSYEIAKGLSVQGRYGTDFYYERQYGWRAVGTRVAQTGDVFENNEYNKTENADLLLTYNHDFGETWSMNVLAGANHQNNRYRLVGNFGSQLSIPGLYAVGRTVLNTPSYNLVESVINSVYASASVGFKNYAFLDLSARNDWSSTLPVQNNSYFYPSVGGSLVVSDALGLQNNYLSYLKLRGSWAQAGRSGNPYTTTGYYNLNANTFQGLPLATYTNTIVDPNLKNELKESYEAGAEVRLFRNRMNIDFTYYHSVTSNQILPIVISESTGYSTKLTNAGKIQNQGIELLVGGTPVRSRSGLTWEASFNLAVNRNKVLELIDGVSELVIGSDRNIRVTAKPGEPYGVLSQADYAWVKDEKGNRLIDTQGLPVRQSISTQPIGNASPRWIGGLSNSLSYKGLVFSSLIDIRRGGQIFSQGRVQEAAYGTSKRTLEGREGGLIAEGVKAKLENGKWVSTGQPNDIPTTAQAYWNRVASDKGFAIAEEFLYDASYIAIRELRLGYQLSADWLKRTPFKSLAVSVYGRNLGYLERHTDGFSPENASVNVNSGTMGMEQHSLPLMRTVGLDLNLSF